LFQPPAVEELRDEVEFDVLGQLDGTPNWVKWYFAELYYD